MPRIPRLALGLGLLTLGAAFGANMSAVLSADSARADEAKVQDKKTEEPLSVRYAELFLKQSQLDLDRALEINRRTPGSFQSTITESLRQTVSIAGDWLAEAKAESTSPNYNAAVPTAVALLKMARDDFARMQAVQRRSPNTVNPIDVERARVSAELAELRVEYAKALDPNSRMDIMNWQVDQLRETVVELYTRVVRLEARN
jgi:hypothetical protein